MNAITVPCTFDRAPRKKDKSVALSFTTNLEINTADYMEMDRLLQAEGWLLFSPSELQEADIPTEAAQSREGKPKGQRLRAVRYLIWKKRGIDEPFEVWYDRWFESLMETQKGQLE